MSSTKTPNYITMSEHRVVNRQKDERVLPVGSFVRPIDIRWLPKHITDSESFRWFDKDRDVFVYCSQGIVPIPKKIIRKV